MIVLENAQKALIRDMVALFVGIHGADYVNRIGNIIYGYYNDCAHPEPSPEMDIEIRKYIHSLKVTIKPVSVEEMTPLPFEDIS